MVITIKLKKSKKEDNLYERKRSEKKRIYVLNKDEYEKFKLVDPIVYNLNLRRKYKGNVIIK